jgi:hypothetical protein
VIAGPEEFAATDEEVVDGRVVVHALKVSGQERADLDRAARALGDAE